MELYNMTEAEMRFADLIWENEPIGSGRLVKLCDERFGWKKSTTYTFLKKLCDQEVFRNEDAVVTSVLDKAAYNQKRGEKFLEDTYDGSLPKLIAAFMNKKKLCRRQVEEIEKMIEEYKEDI